ncbi:MAG TPA: aminotransferase class III-fold pyridoxal phosphate-dependent enzyme, partial [Acidimicrobiales bacterium]|nr:aminotransferase class III-fold pyridoxal phosphate-dependent enzyme [Acidimicrobiales bacterium]
DLWTFGKVIGGGLPVGAFGGRRDVMALLAPLGPVYQAGTLSGNPLATAAGLAVLGALDSEAFGLLTARAGRLASGLVDALGQAGLSVQVPQVGPLVGLFFGPPGAASSLTVRNYDEARASAESGQYAIFFRAMLAQGIALAPGPYEVLFPSLAHRDADIDQTVSAAATAAASMVGVSA